MDFVIRYGRPVHKNHQEYNSWEAARLVAARTDSTLVATGIKLSRELLRQADKARQG
jgi:hypothetical protein